MSHQPPGTFLPNTKVTVGSHKVYIERYLSEGGFAHVYTVRVPRDGNKHELAVLKRVAVPDKEHLANMRTEVETMKKLKGHKHIVTYYDSHASQLKGGGYEVFLLMEYCSGGGLIDFMNTRLQHRLTEPEILKIFGDVAEGVATMHYLKPPLLHRDLKVENVLISKSAGSGTPTYKLCDFGSTAPPRPAAKTVEEGRLIEEDIQKHTTIQYRSPEMIDVWRKHPIDEKSDIWALGVLLYKLCYYTTPFEDVGQMAILNASYKYPSYPPFSDRLRKFIAWMLKEDPKARPNIYQVVKDVCAMRGTDLPIKDIYANRTHSEARRNESLPSTDTTSAPIGLQKATPQIQVQAIPDIAPMRRGRPTAPTAPASTTTKPSPSPARGDPFAALDSKNYDVRAGAVDELSKRFPSLDDFSIAHDGGKFTYSSTPPLHKTPEQESTLNKRVTNALADEVFSVSASEPADTLPKETPPAKPPRQIQAKPVPIRENASHVAQKPSAIRATGAYTSTGTGTSPPSAVAKKFPEVNQRPIWRVPQHDRSTSQPRASEETLAAAALLQPGSSATNRPALLNIHRSKSQTATVTAPSSSRPSLEGQRPAATEIATSELSRSGSVNSPSRPSSMYVSSNMDFLRDQETSRRRPSLDVRRHSRQPSRSRDSTTDEGNISDDMGYLRNVEEADSDRKRSNRTSSHQRKRSSLNALSGAKNILAGRFGDAFKRFEQSNTGEQKDPNSAPLTPEPYDQDGPLLLSPITGSEATPSRHSDRDSVSDEVNDLAPDVKRELERRRLSDEEKRVAAAAAEYRARVTAQGTGAAAPPSKASMIQDRVQSLLDERRDAPSVRRTAEGYGKYTDNPEGPRRSSVQPVTAIPNGGSLPSTGKGLVISPSPQAALPRLKQQQTVPTPPPSAMSPLLQSQPVAALPQRNVSRPSAPPKPKALRTGGKPQWPPPQQQQQSPELQEDPPLPPRPSGLAALLAKDLEGVPDYPPPAANSAQPSNASANAAAAGDDLEADFSKRYPSLSGIEMVETEIKGEGSQAARARNM